MFVSGGQTLQPTLFDTGAPAVDLGFASCEQRALDESSWVEVAPGWMSGADELLAELLDTVRWRQRRVRMYDRMVAGPRLAAWWGLGCARASLRAPIHLDGRQLLSRR